MGGRKRGEEQERARPGVEPVGVGDQRPGALMGPGAVFHAGFTGMSENDTQGEDGTERSSESFLSAWLRGIQEFVVAQFLGAIAMLVVLAFGAIVVVWTAILQTQTGNPRLLLKAAETTLMSALTGVLVYIEWNRSQNPTPDD